MIGGTIKSLFKSGVRDIKKKFSDQNEDDEFATPYGLRIGAAVDIDTLPLRIHAEDLHVELPDETLLIVAQGYVELGDSTYVHRYYSANDTMIQVLTVGGMEDQHVEEITLYVPHQSYYPGNDAEWAQWTANGGKLGASKFQLEDGTEYTRLWFDTIDGYADPVEFTEYIYEDPESDDHQENYQQTMLFGRNLGDDKKNEYLLVTVDAYETEKSVELMVGVDLEYGMLRVI